MDVSNTKIHCPVNTLVVQYSLVVPPSFTLHREEFVEEDLIQQFRHASIEEKQPFFFKWFRTNVSLTNQLFPLDISLFNEESQLVISMLSQFLGLDADRFFLELLMSLLFKMSMSQSDS